VARRWSKIILGDRSRGRFVPDAVSASSGANAGRHFYRRRRRRKGRVKRDTTQIKWSFRRRPDLSLTDKFSKRTRGDMVGVLWLMTSKDTHLLINFVRVRQLNRYQIDE
jgi:hypothetical protein